MNVFQYLAKSNRSGFKAARRELANENRKHTREFVQMTDEQVAKLLPGKGRKPKIVWRSRYYLAQLYQETVNPGAAEAEEYLRLSVNRLELNNDGSWKAGITWDELMEIKQGVGFGDLWAVEVYPAAMHAIDDANMRHLFITAQPPFAWTREAAQEG